MSALAVQRLSTVSGRSRISPLSRSNLSTRSKTRARWTTMRGIGGASHTSRSAESNCLPAVAKAESALVSKCLDSLTKQRRYLATSLNQLARRPVN